MAFPLSRSKIQNPSKAAALAALLNHNLARVTSSEERTANDDEQQQTSRLMNIVSTMMTWGHMIWVFFPIPLFCLLLLSVPFQRIEKFGVNFVGRIFFTRVTVGVVYIRLVYVFIGVSLLIFVGASRTIQAGFGSVHVPCSGTSCPFHGGETMWYRRASRYRAERNFWLSLFTLVLWLLVYNIYSLKEQIVKLRGDLKTIRSDGYKPKNGRSKKDE